MVKDVSTTALVLLKVTKEASVPLPALQAVVGGLLEVVNVYQVGIGYYTMLYRLTSLLWKLYSSNLDSARKLKQSD